MLPEDEDGHGNGNGNGDEGYYKLLGEVVLTWVNE